MKEEGETGGGGGGEESRGTHRYRPTRHVRQTLLCDLTVLPEPTQLVQSSTTCRQQLLRTHFSGYCPTLPHSQFSTTCTLTNCVRVLFLSHVCAGAPFLSRWPSPPLFLPRTPPFSLFARPSLSRDPRPPDTRGLHGWLQLQHCRRGETCRRER